MSVKSIIQAARAAMSGGGTQPGQQTSTGSGNPTGAPGVGAGTPSGLTMEQLLAQLAEQRPALEERFAPSAILFTTGLRQQRKIYPEAEERATYQYLTALCDDAQFGTKVLFCQRDPKNPAQYVEVEGTRTQQLENFWAEALPHSLADERVVAVQTGRAQAFVLPARPQGPATGQQRAADPNDVGVDMEDADAFRLTPQGQDILTKRGASGNAAGGNAPGGNAVN